MKKIRSFLLLALFSILSGQTTKDSAKITETNDPVKIDIKELKQNEDMMTARRKEIKLDETLSNIIQDLDTIGKTLR